MNHIYGAVWHWHDGKKSNCASFSFDLDDDDVEEVLTTSRTLKLCKFNMAFKRLLYLKTEQNSVAFVLDKLKMGLISQNHYKFTSIDDVKFATNFDCWVNILDFLESGCAESQSFDFLLELYIKGLLLRKNPVYTSEFDDADHLDSLQFGFVEVDIASTNARDAKLRVEEIIASQREVDDNTLSEWTVFSEGAEDDLDMFEI